LLQSSKYFRDRRLHFLSMTSAKRSKSKSPTAQPRIALALAGGGPLGAIYEIGALCALDESLQGLSFTRLHHYVGVSAGGFIAAGLANGMTPRELCAAFIENDDKASEVFDPAWLMVPAYGEFLRRGITLPGLLASAAWRATFGRKSFVHALEAWGRPCPPASFPTTKSTRSSRSCFPNPGAPTTSASSAPA
jgi:NTE family protein